ncbi:hypothetical protein SPRG_16064 [Saprolegnia parasitica CBS 223.65]|uniref:Uncharacterized protein n=1 Tax=Saprolegnia parasitica (strain CBS 223.65) TaxID=695850 RepID=A0A067BJI7_SAPPC|nr:hypothetical protein SPRG_16064 [Saprolegnia parasitica CBS 223.65]KDO18599.1 hypothetical protein SPRG_16064 [Saprolegnia parasitica CBS 223.65]|eukprot:XP_012210693.1 hypothetical protein SPRG_16064 [Saprolegnia parasitica CBS 223.65]
MQLLQLSAQHQQASQRQASMQWLEQELDKTQQDLELQCARKRPTSESKNKRLLEADPLTREARTVRSHHTESLAPVKSV